MKIQVLNCLLQTTLLLAVLFFWTVSSRRFGAGTDTSLHPQSGATSTSLNIFFALITALLIGIAIAYHFII